MGCGECDQNLRAELGSKDEEDLTEEEQKILEGEKDPPRYTGPLAPANVDTCSFCHGIGQVGAMFFGGAIGTGIALEVSTGLGILIGLGFWVGLAVTVGYVGHFPVLGPLLGPIVEKIFAYQFGIYLTEKAENKFGPDMPTKQGRRPGEEVKVENRFPHEGTEMHILATPPALERCASMDEPGALVRAEVENGQIVDTHNYHPEFNRFRNVRDHVRSRDPNVTNVCEAAQRTDGPVTTLDFSEVVKNGPEEGIE